MELLRKSFLQLLLLSFHIQSLQNIYKLKERHAWLLHNLSILEDEVWHKEDVEQKNLHEREETTIKDRFQQKL